MTTITQSLSKKLIVETVNALSVELRENASLALQNYTTKQKEGLATKADKANAQATSTKSNWFDGNVVKSVQDDKQLLAFYYSIKASKQSPEMFFRDAMENSYSLEKLVYVVQSVNSGKCVYSVANMSGSRAFALIELIADGVEEFTNGYVFELMNEAKAKFELRPDMGYTQSNQLINMAERLGLVEKVKGKGTAKNGTQCYKFIKNDFYQYLADAFDKQ